MNKSLKSNPRTRFSGCLGNAKIIAALQSQTIVGGSKEIAEELARCSAIISLEQNTELIKQDEYDNDLFFIIMGSVDIIINGRKITMRDASTHVGEMSLLDLAAKRSATVKAREKTVVLKISEPDFTKVANKYPELWRRVASCLASRLKERSGGIPVLKSKPDVFLGSSTEGSVILRSFQRRLKSSEFSLIPWIKGVFEISGTTIESLVKISKNIDFAILIFTFDDMTISRHKATASPRDNVVFELGLFTGAIGRERTFIVKPKGKDIKIPSDLLGVTCLEYEHDNGKICSKSLTSISKELHSIIREKGSK